MIGRDRKLATTASHRLTDRPIRRSTAELMSGPRTIMVEEEEARSGSKLVSGPLR